MTRKNVGLDEVLANWRELGADLQGRVYEAIRLGRGALPSAMAAIALLRAAAEPEPKPCRACMHRPSLCSAHNPPRCSGCGL
jgi:hypothetical protein